MNTGENEQGLRKVIDLTRMISITVLLLHSYYYCYAAFKEWRWITSLSDRLMMNIANTGLFSSFGKAKGIALAFLLISLLGIRGKRSEKVTIQSAVICFFRGSVIIFRSGSHLSAQFFYNHYRCRLYCHHCHRIHSHSHRWGIAHADYQSQSIQRYFQ